MNQEIIKRISVELNIRDVQTESVLRLLSEGNTIPFIARYRKEVTANLDEEQIREINEVYEYQVGLLKRKEDVIRLIDEKELLTEELRINILACNKLVEVEDLYRPYKEKKKTKATTAIACGLEPLAADIINYIENVDKEAKNYLNEEVKTVEDAILGAKNIIAEQISDEANYRAWIRKHIWNNSSIASKVKKTAQDADKIFEMYYEYSELLRNIKPHRVLAINRGEKLKVLTVNIISDNKIFSGYLNEKYIKDENSKCSLYITEAIADSLKRLILPSIEREVRSQLTSEASEVAIDNFSKNLESLLLQPPMKEKMVLGLDPAFRTGCKLAIIDYTGKMIDKAVIFPHQPQKLYNEAKNITIKLMDKYAIDIVAIGNGTASRESEKFIADVIKGCIKPASYIIVNEAGASVYSASKLAIKEFPDLQVEERSAISIARRLQDPLSELVKIDPKSVGVGLYQHDVQAKRLDESLMFVVSKAVNSVGVNINTASTELLTYVSGLNKTQIGKIVKYIDKVGKISSREEIRKQKILTPKAYEQSIGFIRVLNSTEILDKTSIHPESYHVALQLLKEYNLSESDIGTDKISNVLSNLELDNLSKKTNVDKYTLEDIIKSLIMPNRDPRDDLERPILRSDILSIKDLKVGMKLQGTVRNVVDFGVFIDIGIKNDALAHISKLTNRYIKHPSEILNVGDIVECYIDDILEEKKKVNLSLLAK